jgi:tRNA dimethylallyltransferase
MISPTSKLKVLAIVGPTASGKSSWAISLAKAFNGVVLSADSRQVYKGLDAATAKISPAEMDGIPHYLLDIVSIGKEFNAALYQKLAYKILDKIGRDNIKTKFPILPIMAGGTGLYIAAVCDGYQFVDAPPNLELREKLEKMPLDKLQSKLLKLDPETVVDLNNPRRIIRAIEIAESGNNKPSKQPKYDVLKIGIKIDWVKLEKNSRIRMTRLNWDKLFAETNKLSRLKNTDGNPLSIYYQPASQFLLGQIDKKQLIEQMVRADMQYAKRQMTWFKKDKAIHWVETPGQARKMAQKWLNS